MEKITNKTTKTILLTLLIAIFISIFIAYSIFIYSLPINKIACFIIWDILNVILITCFACIV